MPEGTGPIVSRPGGTPQGTGPIVSKPEGTPHVIKVTAKQQTKVNPFQALTESITAVQNKLNDKINVVQKSVNDGIEDLKKLVTTPVHGLDPRITNLEAYLPIVRTVDKKVKDIEPRLSTVENKLNALHVKKVTGPDGEAETALVGGASAEVTEELLQRVDTLENRAQETDQKMNIMITWAGTMYKSHNNLKKQVLFNTAKHHSNDLLIGGIYEYPKQDNCKSAMKFFREKMKLTINENDVLRAYRTGDARTLQKGDNII